jgi:hypothetical protein
MAAQEQPGVGLQTQRATPGYSQDDPLRLDGAAKRLGRWTAPPFIRINHGSRWVKLDFQRAKVDSTVIDIEVIGGAGWILLVVPTGWAADVDRLSTGWGHYVGEGTARAGHRQAASRDPRFRRRRAPEATDPSRRDRRIAARRSD